MKKQDQTNLVQHFKDRREILLQDESLQTVGHKVLNLKEIVRDFFNNYTSDDKFARIKVIEKQLHDIKKSLRENEFKVGETVKDWNDDTQS